MLYVLDEHNNKVEAYDKEGVLAVIEKAIADGSLAELAEDAAFISKIKCCVTGGTNKVAFVPQAKYNELKATDSLVANCIYFITDDNTLDRILSGEAQVPKAYHAETADYAKEADNAIDADYAKEADSADTAKELTGGYRLGYYGANGTIVGIFKFSAEVTEVSEISGVGKRITVRCEHSIPRNTIWYCNEPTVKEENYKVFGEIQSDSTTYYKYQATVKENNAFYDVVKGQHISVEIQPKYDTAYRADQAEKSTWLSENKSWTSVTLNASAAVPHDMELGCTYQVRLLVQTQYIELGLITLSGTHSLVGSGGIVCNISRTDARAYAVNYANNTSERLGADYDLQWRKVLYE